MEPDLPDAPALASPALASPALVSPARTALWRALVGCVLLAAALPFVATTGDLRTELAVIGLGLAIGALTASEHVARRGRLRVAIAWAAALGLPMVLATGVQATYAEHALASGPRAALEATYLRTWLALYDPRTLPTAALWTFALALAPLVRGVGRDARAWSAAAILVLVVAAPSLPDGARGATVVAVAVLLASPLACGVGDALARRHARGVTEAADLEPPRGAPALLALAALGVGVAALTRLGTGPPLVSHTPWLLRLSERRVDSLLERLDLTDERVIAALVAHLDERCAEQRPRTATLLGRLKPPVPGAAVDALARGVLCRERDLSPVAVRSLHALGAAARRAGPLLFQELVPRARDWRSEGFLSIGSQGIFFVDAGSVRLLTLWDDDVLLDMFEDPDPEIALAAFEWLTVTPEMFPRLERLLATPARRMGAALKIAQTGEPALALLRERLARPGVEADPILAVMLNLPQSPASLKLLGDALAHPSVVVREHAARGLRADGPRGAWRGGVDVLQARLAIDPADYLHDALATYPRREER